MSDNMLGQLGVALQELGWDGNDELRVQIGGVANSGIHQTEVAIPKWAKPYGTTSYQNDAFIVSLVISPVISSSAHV